MLAESEPGRFSSHLRTSSTEEFVLQSPKSASKQLASTNVMRGVGDELNSISAILEGGAEHKAVKSMEITHYAQGLKQKI